MENDCSRSVQIAKSRQLLPADPKLAGAELVTRWTISDESRPAPDWQRVFAGGFGTVAKRLLVGSGFGMRGAGSGGWETRPELLQFNRFGIGQNVSRSKSVAGAIRGGYVLTVAIRNSAFYYCNVWTVVLRPKLLANPGQALLCLGGTE